MSGHILAIDPGPKESGVVLYQPSSNVLSARVMENDRVLVVLDAMPTTTIAIEEVKSYGMPVGDATFHTIRWYGRFEQVAYPTPIIWMPRLQVRLALCHSTRATDANVRRAILDRFPATGGGKTPQVGTKKFPGRLYNVKTHAWAALALAIAVSIKLGWEEA